MPDRVDLTTLLQSMLAAAPLASDPETAWTFLRDHSILPADARESFLAQVYDEVARTELDSRPLDFRVALPLARRALPAASALDPGARRGAALWADWRSRRILRLHSIEGGVIPMLELVLEEGRRYRVGGCPCHPHDLDVRHPTADHQVVQLWLERGAVRVRDQGSGWGSRLNGAARPYGVALRDGDVLSLGEPSFRVELLPA